TDMLGIQASLTFDKIGSLRENSSGSFFVTEYVDPNTTAFPKERTAAFKSLEPKYRGPFSTVSDLYHASCLLGKAHVPIDPEKVCREETIEDFETLDKMRSRLRIAEYEYGPFVLFHNDLTVQNILVDDEYNITGIIDFPGTVAPLQSLCVYPWLFHENYAGPMADRDLFYEVFTTREASNQSSLLASKDVRKTLLDTANDRQTFERSLQGVYTTVTLPTIYKNIYGKPYRGEN
ncbi:MAG: hypothetical protein Q9157_000132, partial [Trypethelium eluteriae]